MKTSIRPIRQDVFAVVLVTSAENWQEIRRAFPDLRPGLSLGLEFTSRNFGRHRVVFMQTGTGSISAAASAQHAADRWRPAVMMSAADSESPEADAFAWVAEHNGLSLTRFQDSASSFQEALTNIDQRLAAVYT